MIDDDKFTRGALEVELMEFVSGHDKHCLGAISSKRNQMHECEV